HRCERERFVERSAGHGTGNRFLFLRQNEGLAAREQRTGDGLEGAGAHQYGVTLGQEMEATQVIGAEPGTGIVGAGAVASVCPDKADVHVASLSSLVLP